MSNISAGEGVLEVHKRELVLGSRETEGGADDVRFVVPEAAAHKKLRLSCKNNSSITDDTMTTGGGARFVKIHGHLLETVQTTDGRRFVSLLDTQHALAQCRDALEQKSAEFNAETLAWEDHCRELQEELYLETEMRRQAEEAAQHAKQELAEHQVRLNVLAKMEDYAETLWRKVVERVFSTVKFATEKSVPTRRSEMMAMGIMPDNDGTEFRKNTFADACMDELARCYPQETALATCSTVRRHTWMMEFQAPTRGNTWCKGRKTVTLASVALRRLSHLRSSFVARVRKIIDLHLQRLHCRKDRILFLTQIVQAAWEGTNAPQEYQVLKHVVLSRLCAPRTKNWTEYESSNSLCLSATSRRILQGKCVGQFLTQSDEALAYGCILNLVVVDTEQQTYTIDAKRYTGKMVDRTTARVDDKHEEEEDDENEDEPKDGRHRKQRRKKKRTKADEKRASAAAAAAAANSWNPEGVQQFKSFLSMVKKQRTLHRTLVKQNRPTYFTWEDTQLYNGTKDEMVHGGADGVASEQRDEKKEEETNGHGNGKKLAAHFKEENCTTKRKVGEVRVTPKHGEVRVTPKRQLKKARSLG